MGDPWPTGRSISLIPPPPTDSHTLPSSPPLSSASQPSTGSALIMCSHLATTHGKVPFPTTTTRCRATPLHCPRSHTGQQPTGKDKLPHPNPGTNVGLYRRQQRTHPAS